MIHWLLLLALLSLPHVAAAQRTVAITFDDLPFVSVVSEDDATLTNLTERLLTQLKLAEIPAVGFVNESRLHRDGHPVPARVELLRAWLAAGQELGNHTYAHVSLNRVPLDRFTAEVLQGETIIRPLTAAAGRPLRWFRHPYLHLGKTPAVREAAEAFLAAHGYRVAPVTVNPSEWVFAAAYAHALAQGDAEAAQRIADAYLPYLAAEFARVEQLALDRFGRRIALVLVLHANALNTDHFARLAAMLRERGYRFISLDEALADPAYAQPLHTDLIEGESWLEHWSRAAGLRLAQPPAVPAFVLQWAGAAAIRGY